MTRTREERDALRASLGDFLSVEGLVFLAVGLAVGAMGVALALIWTRLSGRAGDA